MERLPWIAGGNRGVQFGLHCDYRFNENAWPAHGMAMHSGCHS